jgi:hypothetical protein
MRPERLTTESPIHGATPQTSEPKVRISDGFSISREQLTILRHAIGYDDNGGDRYPNARSDDERRNRFVTSPAHEDGKNCQRNVEQGWMADHGAQSMMGGDHYYTVTDEGKAVVRLHAPLKKKLSAAQERYRAWLRADCGPRFGEWLKLKRC